VSVSEGRLSKGGDVHVMTKADPEGTGSSGEKGGENGIVSFKKNGVRRNRSVILMGKKVLVEKKWTEWQDTPREGRRGRGPIQRLRH